MKSNKRIKLAREGSTKVGPAFPTLPSRVPIANGPAATDEDILDDQGGPCLLSFYMPC
jgi:hypothetical protein